MEPHQKMKNLLKSNVIEIKQEPKKYLNLPCQNEREPWIIHNSQKTVKIIFFIVDTALSNDPGKGYLALLYGKI
jgi:hypothetical protein